MKVSKKLALKFAMKEYELRHGKWEPFPDDPDCTLKDEVEQEGTHKYWELHPGSLLATMMFDYAFGKSLDKKAIKKLKRFYGAKLWDEAILCLLNRNHDT